MKMDCSRPDSNAILQKLGIPEDYLIIFHVCEDVKDTTQVLLRSRISSEDGISKFLQKWNETSHVTWRISCTYPKCMSAGKKNIFYRKYHCQHGNRKVRKNCSFHPKHLNCKAEMEITIKKIGTRCKSKDVHLPEFPTTLLLKNDHNHDLLSADNLKWKDVSETTKGEFIRLFGRGYSPYAALNVFKSQLLLRYGDEYFTTIKNNRSLCPDIAWCYRLYYSIQKQKYKKVIHSYTNTDIKNTQLSDQIAISDTLGDDHYQCECTNKETSHIRIDNGCLRLLVLPKSQSAKTNKESAKNENTKEVEEKTESGAKKQEITESQLSYERVEDENSRDEFEVVECEEVELEGIEISSDDGSDIEDSATTSENNMAIGKDQTAVTGYKDSKILSSLLNFGTAPVDQPYNKFSSSASIKKSNDVGVSNSYVNSRSNILRRALDSSGITFDESNTELTGDSFSNDVSVKGSHSNQNFVLKTENDVKNVERCSTIENIIDNVAKNIAINTVTGNSKSALPVTENTKIALPSVNSNNSATTVTVMPSPSHGVCPPSTKLTSPYSSDTTYRLIPVTEKASPDWMTLFKQQPANTNLINQLLNIVKLTNVQNEPQPGKEFKPNTYVITTRLTEPKTKGHRTVTMTTSDVVSMVNDVIVLIKNQMYCPCDDIVIMCTAPAIFLVKYVVVENCDPNMNSIYVVTSKHLEQLAAPPLNCKNMYRIQLLKMRKRKMITDGEPAKMGPVTISKVAKHLRAESILDRSDLSQSTKTATQPNTTFAAENDPLRPLTAREPPKTLLLNVDQHLHVVRTLKAEVLAKECEISRLTATLSTLKNSWDKRRCMLKNTKSGVDIVRAILEKYLDAESVSFFICQMKGRPDSWSDEDKISALQLLYAKPKLYMKLYRTFALPPCRSLAQFSASIKRKEGDGKVMATPNMQ